MRRLAALALLLPVVAAAQPGWRATPDGPSVSADLLYAVGDDPEALVTDEVGNVVESEDVAVTSAALALAVRLRVSSRLLAVVELPLSYTSIAFSELSAASAFDLEDEANAGVGNPYVGAETQLRPDVSLSAGVRLPLASNDLTSGAPAFSGGLRTEMERFEAYLPDTFSALVAVSATRALGDRLRARLRLEPAVLIPTTEETSESGADVAVGYGAWLEGAAGGVDLGAGVYGRRFLTDNRYGTVEVFDVDAVASLSASVAVGGVRPSVAVRVPLTETAFGQDATVGLSLDVPLR